ncbi:MAG: hypothetical protein V1835_00970 [Candidatus Micrarchaeota archaeon]
MQMDLTKLLLALLLVPLAAASQIVIDEPQALACAADQLVLSGYIENTKSAADLFNLRIDSADGISSYVTPEVRVDGYGTSEFKLFLSPICLSIGNYEYKIVGESIRNEPISATGTIKIVDCNLMELRVSQDKAEVCNGESAKFDILVGNLGNEEQKFRISTDLQDKSYSISQKEFTLKPGGEGRAAITLNIPSDLYAQGRLTFKISSQSTYSCGSNSREVLASVSVKRCDGVKITALSELSVQAAKEETWSVIFDNQKTADIYDLQIQCPRFVGMPESKLELGPLESATVNVKIAPKVEDVGEYDCKLAAYSEKFRKTYTASTKIKIVQDYGVKIDAPAEIRACRGEIALVQLSLKNTGIENKYLLSAKGATGTLSKTEIEAAKDSSNDFIYEILDKLATGTYNLEVIAQSPFTAVKSSTKVIVEECYVTAIKAMPQEIGMCAGESGSIAIKAGNGGTQEDTFVLSAVAPAGFTANYVDEAFRLRPSEKKDTKLELGVSETVASGNHQVQLISKGTKSVGAANLNVKVLPVGECHSLNLVPDNTMMRTGAGIGKSFRIMVTNNGRFRENLELYLKEKPAWAYITPTNLEILPGKKEEALIYFAPPLNQKLGEYRLLLEARGKYITKNLDLKVEVVALETAKEAKIDLSETRIPSQIEEGAVVPLKIILKNAGDVDLHKATIFFSDMISVVEQTPFDLKAGERKEIRITVEVQGGSEEKVKLKLGVYAKEGFAEKEFELKSYESRFGISQVSREAEKEGFKVALKLANKGNETLKLKPRSLEGVNFSLAEIDLKPGEEKELEAYLKEGNETIYFEDKISGTVYRKRIEVGKGGEITGLFTASLNRVLPLVIGIMGGAIALYLLISRREKIMRRINGKKGEMDEQDSEGAKLYEEKGETESADESVVIEDEDGPDEEMKYSGNGVQVGGLAPVTDEESIEEEAVKKKPPAKKKPAKKPAAKKRKSGRRGHMEFFWFGR